MLVTELAMQPTASQVSCTCSLLCLGINVTEPALSIVTLAFVLVSVLPTWCM